MPVSDEAIVRLYDTVYDRAPDAGGLGFWKNAAANGLELATMSDYFLAAPEFAATYGQPDSLSFVREMYRNVLDREGEAEGVAHWTRVLDGGHGLDRGDVVMYFSESREHVEQMAANAATPPLPPPATQQPPAQQQQETPPPTQVPPASIPPVEVPPTPPRPPGEPPTSGTGSDRQNPLIGTEGDDTLDGTDLSETVRGLGGNDLLRTGDGIDVLYAGAGDDSLYGGADRDTLIGAEGADVLIGGAGNDLLVGGEGDDVFIFRRGDGFDTIEGFEQGDRIQFEGIVQNQVTLLGHRQDYTISYLRGPPGYPAEGEGTITFVTPKYLPKLYDDLLFA